MLEGVSANVHTYTAPESSFLVNSHIVEGDTKLVVFDGQFFQADAAELAGYLERLGKPVERVILSHPHPDHYSGLQTLMTALPDVPVYALAQVKAHVEARGEHVLAARRELFGDAIADRVPEIQGTLPPGEHTIDGVHYVFEHLADAEAEHQLLVELPELGVMAPFDLVSRAEHHLFTVRPAFDSWIDHLRGLERRAQRSGHLLLGHGPPAGPAAIEASIVYLQEAKRIFGRTDDPAHYASLLEQRFPERVNGGWIHFAAAVLYGAIAPA
jgi:glyoxylase-like metal-dependent hydrolase (beta-lactamase superfamily II)